MGCHRADVRTPTGLVIEFQNSPITPEDILERERFYGRMLWVFNAAEFADNLSLRKRDGFLSFRWRWPRQSLWAVTRPMYFDLGSGSLLRVRKVHHRVPCGGWGIKRSMTEFVSHILKRTEAIVR